MRNKKVVCYATSKAEAGKTYELIDIALKEQITKKEIFDHWEARAERPGVHSVMSARHTLKENIRAAELLKNDIADFLKGYFEGKCIFELGCGIGRMTEMLAEKAESMVAADFSPKMIRRARQRLSKLNNVRFRVGRVLDLELKPKSFDLVFECIVLLHILNPDELKKTIEKMKSLSDVVFICEHTYEGPDFPISKYSILRKPEEYEKMFRPFKLIKHKTHFCAGDRFTLILFKK